MMASGRSDRSDDDDAAYFRARAAVERRQAAAAGEPGAAGIHLELARLLELRAAEADRCGDDAWTPAHRDNAA